jgi:sortase A
MIRSIESHLRIINDVLTCVVVVFALYLILLPFLPDFTWWIHYQAPLISKHPATALPQANTPAAPEGNTLIIPAMALDQPLHEGRSEHALHFGVWHLPGTGNPEKGGNTVLAGHRYTYSGSGVFYHLDKVQIGDDMTLFWNHKRYDYSVTNIQVVPPTDVAVQAPTKDNRLTVYTCTPMWTFKNRLVITGELERAS